MLFDILESIAVNTTQKSLNTEVVRLLIDLKLVKLRLGSMEGVLQLFPSFLYQA